jgi:peptidyl-prolyl cis-trans isomerase A (cyclophilin A)
LLAALALGGCPAGEKEVKAPPEPETPPEVYRVKFETTKGDFIIEVTREWAPRGADHFFDLVQNGFYDGARFFRVVRRFVAQFGINGDPSIQRLWSQMRIRDDPVKQSNKKGFVSFAKLGPQSRTTQVFINLRDNTSLDKDGFAPFGEVVEGMEVIERFWSSYGEVAPRGSGPDPARIEMEGNTYLDQRFPRLDSILRATILKPAEAPPPEAEQ